MNTNIITEKRDKIMLNMDNNCHINTSGVPRHAMNTDVYTTRRRRIASIFQHYYPEGGWGIIVLVCGFFAELISYGLQQVLGVSIVIISNRFRISESEKIGKR